MAVKGMKCCCSPPCTGPCIGIGSLFPQCSVCSESPLRFRFIFPSGGPWFVCCSNLLIPTYPAGSPYAIVSDIVGDPTSLSCAWRSGIKDCGGGLTAYWELSIAGILAGSVTLTIYFSDGRIVQYVNRTPWSCLCPNQVFLETTSGMESCHLPPFICVIPFMPCCGTRTRPMPRTLYVQMSERGTPPADSCPCIGGMTPWTIDWTPLDDDWEGTGPWGGCGPKSS